MQTESPCPSPSSTTNSSRLPRFDSETWKGNPSNENTGCPRSSGFGDLGRAPLTPLTPLAPPPFHSTADPSDHLPTHTIMIVARSSGSGPAITGESFASAPQLFASSPPLTKNIRCGCQLLPLSFRYCCFDIM